MGETRVADDTVCQRERERALEAQLRQSQKLEAIGALAGGVAHDFNNLLTVINGRAQLLLMRLKPDDPLREEISLIAETGERAAALTRQLLTFSRKQALAPQVLDLNAAVADMEKLLKRLVRADIEMTTALAPKLARVTVDPGQIGQALVNLVVNACDAMPRGGRLTIETANVAHDEAYAAGHAGIRPGQYVLLAVSDTGCGMSAAVKNRLFEPFFTTKEKGKGTGLGLSTVYGIVRQSGGHIEVYSEVGRGTTFKIYLPQAEPAPAPHPAPPPSKTDAAAGRQEVILVVEDTAAVRELLRDVLLGAGYTVLTATDGAEALALAKQRAGPIHLVMSDMVMPGLGGLELADELSRSRAELKVLFLSGYTQAAMVGNGTLRPGAPFIEKPFTGRTVLRKVREVLDAPAESTPRARPRELVCPT